MAYRKFGPIFKKCQNLGGRTIYKDVPCVHDTKVFAMKFRESLSKLFYKQEIMEISKRNIKGKRQKEIMIIMW